MPPKPQPSAAEHWVEQTLSALSLRERVAQLVVPWISGDPASPGDAELQRLLRAVEQDGVGGIIISRGSPRALAAKLHALQARARVPLLVVSDLETGPGMRLTPGGTVFPPAMAFGAAGSETLAREAGRVTAAEARAVGIHLTLGPVLDVNSNPANPIINTRSFGGDPAQVARLGAAWIEGARGAGLLTAPKHFPGHGDTEADSHIGGTTIAADSARLDTLELVPFRAAIRAGTDAVLVGHIAVPALEGPGAAPASLSPWMTTGLLRGRLGFGGLVFTDAMNMGAVTRRFSVPEASVRALEAGADLLLQPPGETAVIDAVVAAVRGGRIPPERIDASVRRVLAAKAAAGLDRGVPAICPALADSVGTAAHRAVARRVAQASIVLVRDRDGRVPLGPGTGTILHLSHAEAGRGDGGALLGELLRAGGLRLESVAVGERTGAVAFAALRARAAAAELVLVSIAVAPHAGRGSVAMKGALPAWVDALARSGKPVVVVSLGSPYLLPTFPTIGGYLLAWSSAEASQRAAAAALLGATPVTGRLPAALPPWYAIGDGISLPRPSNPLP